MDFEPTEERRLLKEVVRSALQDRWSTEDVRATEDDPDLPAKLWPVLHQLGVTTLTLDDREPPADPAVLDQVVVAQALGTNLAPLTFVWSGGLATELVRAASPPDLKATLNQILRAGDIVTIGLDNPGRLVDPTDDPGGAQTGSYVATCATGAKRCLVLLPPTAEDTDALEVAVVDLEATPGERIERTDLQDLRRLPPTSLGARFRVPTAAVRDAVARTKLLIAAYAVGAGERVTELATTYARERHQFGRPIGSFQAVAHRCVDMHTTLGSADALTALAAWQLATGRRAQASRSAALAKADATEALADAAAAALQVFGGHGFSVENDVQLFFRLGRGLEATWGTPAQEREVAGQPVDAPPGEVVV